MLRDREGRCQLVALSANPIWRERRGQRCELEKGDKAIGLAHGDEILLFTGATERPQGLGLSCPKLDWRTARQMGPKTWAH